MIANCSRGDSTGGGGGRQIDGGGGSCKELYKRAEESFDIGNCRVSCPPPPPCY